MTRASSTWTKRRLRHCLAVDPPISAAVRDDPERRVSFLPMEAISEQGGLDLSRTIRVGDAVAGYTFVADGDVVIAKVTPCFENGKGARASGLETGVGFATTEVFTLRPTGEMDPRFLDFLLRSTNFRQYGTARLTGAGGLKRLSATDLRNFEVMLPPPSQQRVIADFLDRETARIDMLIAEQQRLVELLRERRESVADLILAELGLRIPDRLEDYAGGLPDGWRVVLLGQALEQLTNGFVGPTRDILVEQGIRYIQGTHIKHGRIDFERRPFYVSHSWHEERPRIHLRAGDVLIVQTGDVGKVAVVPPAFGDASCHALLIARTRRNILSGEYLATFLSSRLGYQSLLVRATGALHPHLESGIRNAPVVVPPPHVQDHVVDAVNEQTSKIDTLIAETERFIELSRERRSALITAAVTGQIDLLKAVA